jgi:hypothetical protein
MRSALLALSLALVVGVIAGCGDDNEPAAATAPSSVTTGTVSPSSPTREDLPDLGVALADLPTGFSVRREGYLPAQPPIAAGFRRAFDPGDASLGESALADLISEVVLYENSEDADVALEGILLSLLGNEVEQRFGAIVHGAVGIDATNLKGETAPADIGDKGVVSHATFDTSAGRAEAVFVAVRVGRLQQEIFMIGPRGSVHVEDATALAAQIVPKLEEAAGSQFTA